MLAHYKENFRLCKQEGPFYCIFSDSLQPAFPFPAWDGNTQLGENESALLLEAGDEQPRGGLWETTGEVQER